MEQVYFRCMGFQSGVSDPAIMNPNGSGDASAGQRARHESSILGHGVIGDEAGFVPVDSVYHNEFRLGKHLGYARSGLGIDEHVGEYEIVAFSPYC